MNGYSNKETYHLALILDNTYKFWDYFYAFDCDIDADISEQIERLKCQIESIAHDSIDEIENELAQQLIRELIVTSLNHVDWEQLITINND